MDIVVDPGDKMNELLDVFASRRRICDILIKTNEIKLTLVKLLLVLDNLKRLDSDTI